MCISLDCEERVKDEKILTETQGLQRMEQCTQRVKDPEVRVLPLGFPEKGHLRSENMKKINDQESVLEGGDQEKLSKKTILNNSYIFCSSFILIRN